MTHASLQSEAASIFDRLGVPAMPELHVGPEDRDNALAFAEGLSRVPGAD